MDYSTMIIINIIQSSSSYYNNNYYIKNPEMCSVDIALYGCCVHSRSLVSPSLMTDEVMTKDEDQHHL